MRFIRDVLAQDPRPAYQYGKADEREYGIWLGAWNIKWRLKTGETTEAEVLYLEERR